MKTTHRRSGNLIIILAAAVLMTLLSVLTAYALSVRIAFSDPTATAGQEFEVSMKISSLTDGGKLGSADIMLNYDPAYIEFVGGDNVQGGAGSLKVSGQATADSQWAYKLKFKAMQAGQTSITVGDWEIYDGDSKAAELGHDLGSSAINILPGEGASANAALSALKISPGVLEPAFSPDVTEYTATVGGSTDKITVSAPTSDSNAKVVISGNADLIVGENTVTAKVTAEDGSTRTYTINVTKQEGEISSEGGDTILTATVNGSDYEVVPVWDESILPEGFTVGSAQYKGSDVMTGENAERGVTIMYLIGSDGSGDFFVYDAEHDLWSPFAQINVSEKSVMIVPISEDVTVPEGFADTTLALNGKKVRGWIWSSDEEQKYCIVYGVNASGEKNFYRYDMKEKTIQRYFEDPAAEKTVSEQEYLTAATAYNELLKDYNLRGYILLGLAVIAAILLIAFIAMLFVNKRSGSSSDSEKQDRAGRSVRQQPAARERGRRERVREEIQEEVEAAEEEQSYSTPRRMSEAEQYMMGLENVKSEKDVRKVDEDDDFEDITL